MPVGLRLPCSSTQALALYQQLFGCPAGLGQLQAVLRQVPGSQACPSGLELPLVLLEMERSRRAQEQLLWDLELLTGAGLGLFWPPRAPFHSLWGQGVWSRRDKPRASTVGGSELLLRGNSGLQPSPQAADSLSRDCPFSAGGQREDVVKAGSDTRRASGPAVPTPDGFQELKSGGSSAGEPGGSELKDFTGRGERDEAELVTHRAPGQSGLKPRVPSWVLCWDRDQELAELEKLLRIGAPQRHKEGQPQEPEERPQGQTEQAHQGQPQLPKNQRGEVSGGHSGETPQGESPEAPPGKSPTTGAPPEPRGETPQGQEEGVSSGCCTPQAQEEGDYLDISRPLGSSLGEQLAQPGERGSPGPQGRTTQPLQDQEPGPAQAGAGGLHPSRLTGPAVQEPQDCRTSVPACSAATSGLQEGPAAPTVHAAPGLQGSAGTPEQEVGEARELWAGPVRVCPAAAAEAPKVPKTAWPRAPGVSAAQQESALQRLLELHRAARRRRGRDREQQRLRVLEGLRIARNRRCRVHPLGPPLQQAQLPLQEDAAGQRRALQEHLQQVHRERTGRLRAQGARNTQNFQQLLWPPGTSEPKLKE